jgi:hypothetical protein
MIGQKPYFTLTHNLFTRPAYMEKGCWLKLPIAILEKNSENIIEILIDFLPIKVVVKSVPPKMKWNFYLFLKN